MVTCRTLAPFVTPATVTSGHVAVRDGDGRRLAVARRRGDGARARWRWSATDPALGTFVVEPSADDDDVWFVTRTDGAPFGQLRAIGRLRPRLDVLDGRGSHLTVHTSGAVRDDARRVVARVRRLADDEVELAERAELDPTSRTLLLAACLVRPRRRRPRSTRPGARRDPPGRAAPPVGPPR